MPQQSNTFKNEYTSCGCERHLTSNNQHSKIVEKDLDEIVNQLPTHFLLLGDFNGHHFIWGADDVNDKGRIIENFINKNNLCLYNNKTPTYLHPATGTYTSLDLSICYPPRARPGVERIGRTPPPLAQSVETWPIGVRLVCRELRPVSLEERILVIERVGCGRHATHYFGLNFS